MYGSMSMLGGGVLALVLGLVYLAVLLYLITLAARLVKASERAATALERLADRPRS